MYKWPYWLFLMNAPSFVHDSSQHALINDNMHFIDTLGLYFLNALSSLYQLNDWIQFKTFVLCALPTF